MGEVSQFDLFAVHAAEPPLRDNRDVMEYPFLSLQKVRTKPIEFTGNGVSLSVAADVRSSIATIWDWDILIFAAAHLNDAIEAGLKPSPRVQFAPHDCLRQVGRSTGGQNYRELANAIRRLHMTTVITNIRDGDIGEEGAFHWLEGYRIPKRYSVNSMSVDDKSSEADPSRPWEVTLPSWLYNSITRRREILAVHPDYFQLTGGLERWLYRLARKAVPDKAEVPAIPFSMDTLYSRSCLTRPKKSFAFDVRKIAEANGLPEYGIRIERDGRNELVIFYRDRMKPARLLRGIKKPEFPPLRRQSG